MKRANTTLIVIIILVVVAVVVLSSFLLFSNQEGKETTSIDNEKITLSRGLLTISEDYNPEINPDDFTTDITNPYYSMPVGKKMVYKAELEEGVETTVTLIPGWTKEIMGIDTLVFWDRVYLDDQLVEDTRDYIVQDKEGNVWYFGEDVDDYVDGKLSDHEGAWISGEDGAEPGILMPADPLVGDEFRQEYLKGEAEDSARVEAIDVSVTTPLDSYSHCVQTYEFSPISTETAYKYHCLEIGGTALEVEEEEKVELTEVDMSAAKCIILPDRYADEGVLPGATEDCSEDELVDSGVIENPPLLEKNFTQEEIEAIALEHLSGRVTEFGIEMKNQRKVYVVEIIPDKDPEKPYMIMSEKDVIIDFYTGEFLRIES